MDKKMLTPLLITKLLNAYGFLQSYKETKNSQTFLNFLINYNVFVNLYLIVNDEIANNISKIYKTNILEMAETFTNIKFKLDKENKLIL